MIPGSKTNGVSLVGAILEMALGGFFLFSRIIYRLHIAAKYIHRELICQYRRQHVLLISCSTRIGGFKWLNAGHPLELNRYTTATDTDTYPNQTPPLLVLLRIPTTAGTHCQWGGCCTGTRRSRCSGAIAACTLSRQRDGVVDPCPDPFILETTQNTHLTTPLPPPPGGLTATYTYSNQTPPLLLRSPTRRTAAGTYCRKKDRCAHCCTRGTAACTLFRQRDGVVNPCPSPDLGGFGSCGPCRGLEGRWGRRGGG